MLMYDNEHFYDSKDALQALTASEQPVDRYQAFTSNLLGSRPEVTVENVNRSYPTMNPPIRHPSDIFWSFQFR
jgi:hypothetical protein